MSEQKADMYLMINAHNFDSHMIPTIREKLVDADDRTWSAVQGLDLKDSKLITLISFFGGQLGIDRFMIGDTGLGIAKLLTCGGFMIWTIVDWFMISAATKRKNMIKLSQIPELGINYVG